MRSSFVGQIRTLAWSLRGAEGSCGPVCLRSLPHFRSWPASLPFFLLVHHKLKIFRAAGISHVRFGSKANVTLGHPFKYSEKGGSRFISLDGEEPIQTGWPTLKGHQTGKEIAITLPVGTSERTSQAQTHHEAYVFGKSAIAIRIWGGGWGGDGLIGSFASALICLKTLVADAVPIEPVSACFTCSSGKSWRAYADFGRLLQCRTTIPIRTS